MKKWLAAALLVAAGCSRPKPGDVPSIRYGLDNCARCGMAVGEERFACGYVDKGGGSVAFDDVGEFLDAAREDSSLAAVSFVHDARSGRWLRASDAFYIQIPGLATPMGSGFAAFASEAGARSFAKQFGSGAGRPLSFSAALASKSKK